MTRERDMTATLGETYSTTAAPAAEMGVHEARRLSPRRARRDLTTRVASSSGSRRVAGAMVGVLGLVALAGALVQIVAG
jgi:hypothetical protein